MHVPGLPPSLRTTHELHERGPVRVLVRKDWADVLPVEALLDGCPLTAWGRPVEHDLVGRGPVHVLETARGPIVAKALSRGGLVGGLLRTWFADVARSWREADVAERLAAAGVRTPPVVVARSTRGKVGLHRLELASARIEGARDLLAVLPEATDPLALAGRVGSLVRRLHDLGLRHRDLQVKNLLVPADGSVAGGEGGKGGAGELVVLDLDRCSLDEHRPLVEDERLASLTRFARSLVKQGLLAPPRGGAGTPGEKDGRASGRPVGESEVRAFLGAYGALPGHSLEDLRADLCRRLAGQVARHRWGWSAPTK